MTIDGPAGAGKTTAGVWVAHAKGLRYLETGLLYRGLALLPPALDGESIADTLRDVMSRSCCRQGRTGEGRGVYHQNVEVSPRSPEVEARLAELAPGPGVRHVVAAEARRLVGDGCCVVVGRATGTEVCPSAQLKLS